MGEGNPVSVPTETDVLVVGGGPAGSTAAGLLARRGHDVTLLERDRFPRYHIGESILPSCLPVLDLLGAREKIEAHGFVRKEGAYFEWGKENWDLDFNHIQNSGRYSFQVVRSEFDELLLRHAASQGVHVAEEVEVTGIEFDGSERPVAASWKATSGAASGAIQYRYLVDASGRAGLLSVGSFRSRRYHEAFKNVAVWRYWKNVPAFQKGPPGAIIVTSIRDGWLWGIPLHDGTMSVGVVIARSRFSQDGGRQELETLYATAVEESDRFAELLAGAERVTELKVERDYSYASGHFCGPGYTMAGDAACFLDPLLSTGVHLATFSGLLSSATIGTIFDGDMPEEQALTFYESAYRQAYERLLILVSFFYRTFDREAQFFEADKLTRRERHMLNLYESFLYIVSGIEDIDDAKDSAVDVLAQRRAAQGIRNAGEASVVGTMPLSPHQTVNGIYLSTDHPIALRRLRSEAATVSR